MQPTADPPSPALTGDVDITPGMALPLPDDAAGVSARERLSSIDIGVCAPTVTALGMLSEAVVFIAGVQGSAYPRPLLSTRVVLLTGSHAGGVVAGPTPDPRNAAPLQHLAVTAGAGIVTLEWQPASAAIELEDAITSDQMDAALRAGWAEAERAADEGIELIVLAAGGAGAATAAAAVIAAITGAEPPALLPRVVTPAGRYDDNAWMTRCLALRDALHRVRTRHGDPRTVLAALGGADIAAATGMLLGAAWRKTPVMIDGPVGAAAALLANDFSAPSRRWVMLPDTGRHPAVRLAAEALELRPWLDLCLDLGEGCACLVALPMLQTALTLAGAGEPVDDTPLTRYDSSGNQVFVGVARPVEPPPGEDGAVEPADEGETTAAVAATTKEPAPGPAASASAGDSSASAGDAAGDAAGASGAAAAPAKTTPAPPKVAPTKVPAKAAPAKATPAKTTAAAKPTPAKAVPARATPAKDATPKDATPKDAFKEKSAKESPVKEATPADDSAKEPPTVRDAALPASADEATGPAALAAADAANGARPGSAEAVGAVSAPPHAGAPRPRKRT